MQIFVGFVCTSRTSWIKELNITMTGCKWNLRQLRQYFHQAGIKDWLLWQRISSLVVLTVASQLHGIPSSNNCFEFYGFDVLLDKSLKPWLLEVSISTCVTNSSSQVKEKKK